MPSTQEESKIDGCFDFPAATFPFPPPLLRLRTRELLLLTPEIPKTDEVVPSATAYHILLTELRTFFFSLPAMVSLVVGP